MTEPNSNITFLPHPTHHNFRDLTGKVFERLTVLGFVGRNNKQMTLWLCQCNCGRQITVRVADLNNGHSRSCGCLQRDTNTIRCSIHGAAGDNSTVEYAAWQHLTQRCKNPNDKAYGRYGGRVSPETPITVCDRWLHSFPNFLADMGLKPSPKYSIERKNNDGNYEPGNCIWATKIEQGNNRRSNHTLTLNGKTQSIAIWSRERHISYTTLQSRLWRGWSDERALTTPVRARSLTI